MYPLLSFSLVLSLAFNSWSTGIIQETNNYRSMYGLNSVSRTYSLSELACYRLRQIDNDNYFSHAKLYTIRDYMVGNGYTSWGENLAAGYYTPGATVGAWKRSPMHNAVLLGNYRHVGVCTQYVNMGGFNTQITVQLLAK